MISAGQLYWLIFVSAFLGVAVWETLQPLGSHAAATGRRWRDHAFLFAVSAVLGTVAVRLLPAGAAALVVHSPLGILNRTALPFVLRCALGVILLDFLQYWIHRSFHGLYPLWRIHEVHHSDPDYDVSIAIRFHPLELLPSQLLHGIAALLLAPPPVAVLVSQLLAMLVNIVSHANARFPPAMERALRPIFITPDLHRIHHSAHPGDLSLNFGQTFSFWDRIFGTYAAQSSSPALRTGVDGLYSAQTAGVAVLLARPFRSSK